MDLFGCKQHTHAWDCIWVHMRAGTNLLVVDSFTYLIFLPSFWLAVTPAAAAVPGRPSVILITPGSLLDSEAHSVLLPLLLILLPHQSRASLCSPRLVIRLFDGKVILTRPSASSFPESLSFLTRCVNCCCIWDSSP